MGQFRTDLPDAVSIHRHKWPNKDAEAKTQSGRQSALSVAPFIHIDDTSFAPARGSSNLAHACCEWRMCVPRGCMHPSMDTSIHTSIHRYFHPWTLPSILLSIDTSIHGHFRPWTLPSMDTSFHAAMSIPYDLPPRRRLRMAPSIQKLAHAQRTVTVELGVELPQHTPFTY